MWEGRSNTMNDETSVSVGRERMSGVRRVMIGGCLSHGVGLIFLSFVDDKMLLVLQVGPTE